MAEEQNTPAASATESADNAQADDIMADWAAAMSEQEAAETTAENPSRSVSGEAGATAEQSVPSSAASAKTATPVPMPELQASRSTGTQAQNLDMILDIPVTLSVELGKTKIQIRNLLQLAQGSVVELERLAGEPMDVLVNGYLIAQGEVVLVNDKFGIRLTDIVSPAERAKKLR
ncbi:MULTISPECIES: flagellar motor switch protein FliN [Acidithiobacillus]|jgi:flagellar motor switch protein FliN/FliY|uniref:Flagellar motor switch protein FliN n=3 Tax=Acidithiobacillus thiooxidans TaxID=930 RepID=A0A1C2I1A6_ACITH|nr:MULTISPECIES: flagellar motor switch protein FliN [Acidithiobacillus]QFX95625.1 flagellar motor switch protein FliN [Acidithiobacillus thiooxidans ATCC 19377]MBE7565522.1 flagellar motor switch protein FliN [Acidithiobacillus sp. HP-11]OCX69801.1 flagellar motor switch protein FliN [Acidithiobacillus thiooxidans]OCX70045.1 flagellar motor switch protein FliN [Acidithiobacillus thiooxidans]OCX76025.1 flagellar motor switch protein FliN [Acidithiobacillus thiooxidans]